MDLARLGFDFDGKGAAAAEQAYDRLESGAKGVETATTRAERATERLSRAARGLDPAVNDVAAAMRQQRQVMDAARAATGLTSNEMLNLTRQTADVGVSIASGMPLWMVLIQQGSQVGDTFQVAARRGVGFRLALDSIYLRLAPLLAPLAAAGIAIGAIGSAFALAARDVNRGSDEMMRDLHLTADQMERLKEEGVDMGVTMGDVFRGIGTTIKEVLGEAFGPQIDQAKSAWSSFMDDLGHNTMNEIRQIVGFFTGAYGAITATWSLLPAALGDAAYSAANATVGALNWMLRKAVDAIQFLRDAYNALPPALRGGQEAPRVGDAYQISQAHNPFPGGMNAAIGAGGAGYERRRAEGIAWVGDVQNQARGNIEDSWEARQRSGAGDAGTEAERAAKAAREVREVMQGVERINLSPLAGQFQRVITPLEQAAYELAVIDDLTRNLGDGLASAFGQGGEALADMLSNLTSYRAQMAAWRDEEANGKADFMRLAEIQAQRGQAQIGMYGDMAAAARGFFEEGSTGYKAMLAIEQAYRVQQLIGMVQSIMMGQTETASTVANSATKGTALAGEGAARMFAMLGPYAFPAVAAMIGLLAGLGLKSGGGGGANYRPANDNGPSAATEAVRAQSSQSDAARGANQRAFAQAVEVRVTADRDGLNAYVVGTAEKVAAPMAIQSGQMAARVGQARTEAAAARRSEYTLRSGRR